MTNRAVRLCNFVGVPKSHEEQLKSFIETIHGAVSCVGRKWKKVLQHCSQEIVLEVESAPISLRQPADRKEKRREKEEKAEKRISK